MKCEPSYLREATPSDLIRFPRQIKAYLNKPIAGKSKSYMGSGRITNSRKSFLYQFEGKTMAMLRAVNVSTSFETLGIAFIIDFET